jgi:hypothetical protein
MEHSSARTMARYVLRSGSQWQHSGSCLNCGSAAALKITVNSSVEALLHMFGRLACQPASAGHSMHSIAARVL